MGKFKQGDRVKALVNGIDYKIGDEFVLTADGDGKRVYFDDNAGDDRMRPQEEFELLPVPDKKPPFKVGDRVRLLTNNNGFGAVGALGTAKRINCGDVDCLVHFDDEFLGDRQWYAKWCDLELVATLQIEAGKYYRTRDGRKVGPMVEFVSGRYRECDGDGRWWDKYGVGHMYAKGDDLIAEWVDEPVTENTNDNTPPVTEQREAEPRRFKVGDKVRALVDYCWVKSGTEYIVNSLDSDGDVWLKNVDGKDAYMTDSELELITPVEEAQKPDSHNGDEAIKPTLLRTKQGYGFEIARHGDYVWVDTGQKAPIVLKAADVQAAA